MGTMEMRLFPHNAMLQLRNALSPQEVELSGILADNSKGE
jgi:hypothetical protein